MHETKRRAYREGEAVRFVIPDTCEGTGRIRGCATSGLIDVWIIEPDASAKWEPKARAMYPFSCVVVTHPGVQPM